MELIRSFWFLCSVSLLPVKALYSLEDEESEGMIVINLLPLLSQSYRNTDDTADLSKEKRSVVIHNGMNKEFARSWFPRTGYSITLNKML